MPLPPLHVSLTDAEKIEVVKRTRGQYQAELTRVEDELTAILRSKEEADFLAQYIGEQPEVVALRQDPAKVETLNKRRQYLGMILERLDAVIGGSDRSRKGPALFQRF